MTDRHVHLSDDQILIFMVDENGLSEDNKRHFLSCRVCREKKMALTDELKRLGKMAGDFAPMPRHRPLAGFQEARFTGFRRPSFAAGLAAVLIIACLCSLMLFSDSPKQITARSSREMKADMHLMEDMLEESALPEYVFDVTVVSYSYFDDEFLKFVAPLEEQLDSVSQRLVFNLLV